MKARTAAATRGSGRRRRTRRCGRSAAAAAAGRCTSPRSDRGVSPVTSTCSRSSDESTNRAVPPRAPSSPSTCHGSSACRSVRWIARADSSPATGKRNSKCGANQRRPRRSRLVASSSSDIVEVEPDEIRQHEPVVQLGAPARQRLSRTARARSARPARAAAAAAPGSSGRQAASRTRASRRRPRRPEAVSGEYSLSMQNSARCVLPVTSTSRCRSARSTSHGGTSRCRRPEARERELDLVDAVVAAFVDSRRLARRSEEQSREQVRQRRVVVPVADQAAQQIGPPQERAVAGRGAAEHEVIAAAGAGVAAVEHELLGSRGRPAALPRRASSSARRAHPSCDAGWMFTSMTPGSGVMRKCDEPRIGRRRIALEQHAHAEARAPCVPRRRRDRGSRSTASSGGMNTYKHAAARFDAQRRTHDRRERIRRGCGSSRDAGRPRVSARCGRRRFAADVSSRRCGASRPARRAASDGERRRVRERVALDHVEAIAFGRPRQRVQRQPQSHRRIARHQVQPLAAQEPRSGRPARASVHGESAARSRRPRRALA